MKTKLHLGCGTHVLSDWINIDNFDEKSFDQTASKEGILVHDVRNGFPFESDSVDYIFHSHVIEHMSLPQAQQLLRECYRVLKPGGVLRMCLPDLELAVGAYLKKDSDWYHSLGVHAPTHCELFNIGARSWGHEYLYDEEDMRHRLQQANFDNNKITRVKHGESIHAELKGIDNRKPGLDMCIEVVK